MNALRTRVDVQWTIVDTAARLLAEHGSSAVTTRRVAEQAGVQAPTIYRLFGDKEGLLEAVAEHAMEIFVASKADAVDAASDRQVDPLDDLRAGWNMQIDFGVANPALFAIISDASRSAQSPAVLSGKRVLARRVHRIALIGRLRVSEHRAVDLIHAAGTGVVLAINSTGPESRDAGLADDMYDAVLRQILVDPPSSASGSTKATTVAFRAVLPGLDVLSNAERSLLRDWLDRAIDAP